MIPKDHMLYGEEGMLYREYRSRLAREGVPSSEIPGFREWQKGEAGKFREINVREDESRRRYGIIKLVAIGLATYLAFQVHNCFSDVRHLDKKGYSPIERSREDMKQDSDTLPMNYRMDESKKVRDFIDTYINPSQDQLDVHDLDDPIPKNLLDGFESKYKINIDKLLEPEPEDDKNTRQE